MSDAEFLSRVQFGFVVSFHILFPAFTIGLANWLAFLEGVWLWKREDRFRDLYFFWMRLFAVSFAMGVVSGIVMSFQFGTNWARFTDAAGNVIGPLMNYEVLTAFFLEASFLGVMLFGWRRVGHGTHFFATCMVALGTLISTFWIISANSWMQTPAGYAIHDGELVPTDWWAAIFNPSFPYRLTHMVLAAFITTAMVVGGVGAAYLRHGRFVEKARPMLKSALGFLAIAVPLQMIVGDLHGLFVRDHQPAKLAAIESHWETGRDVPLILFATPDEAAEANRYSVAVPHLGSLILTHSLDREIVGLKDFPREDRPPVAPVFFGFRVMVGIALLMLALTVTGMVLWWRGRLFDTGWYLRLFTWLSPAGFVAVLAGWYVTEIGRQPWLVYGVMRRSEGFSGIPAASVSVSLAAFLVAYSFIFGFGGWYLWKLIRTGPVAAPRHEPNATPARPLSVPDEPVEEAR